MVSSVRQAILLCLLVAVIFASNGNATTYELRGTGILPDIENAPAGVPGEDITISVTLTSENFNYVSVGNEIVHYFLPSVTIPVQIVGSLSGPYSNVSPIERFVALELENSANPGDRINLDVASGSSGTSLLVLSTDGMSGFDGGVTPFNSDQLFTLFEEAMRNELTWQKSSSSSVLIGSSGDLLFLGELDWSLDEHLEGDFNSDGQVNGRDFLLWQENPQVGELTEWQDDFGTESVALAVPEPQENFHWLISLAAGIVLRRIRRF